MTAAMREDLREDFRRRLATMRLALARTVSGTDDELATLERHEAGGVVDDATTTIVSGLLSRLDVQERRELEEIVAAEARLDDGTYGFCETCGSAIPLERLRVVPATRHCVPCQARVESVA